MNESSIEKDSINDGPLRPKFRPSRHERPFSLYSRPNFDWDLNKVIIPYNFEEKQYMINEKSIEFFDKKDYLVNKLNEYNRMSSFQIQNKYHPSLLQQLGMYFPCFILSVVLLYLAIIILAFFSFNPVLIYTFAHWGLSLSRSLKGTQSVFLDKFRIAKIKAILDEETAGEFCKVNNLLWRLGQSGYWLELEKLL